MAIALQRECRHAADMDIVVHDVLHREEAGLAVDHVGLFGAWRWAQENAARHTLQPAAVHILAREEAADLMAFQPT